MYTTPPTFLRPLTARAESSEESSEGRRECQIAAPLPPCNAAESLLIFGAGDRDRTGDVQLGKLTFYR